MTTLSIKLLMTDAVSSSVSRYCRASVMRVLGKKDSKAFCQHFDITSPGNFEGKNIPNLLRSDPEDKSFEQLFVPLCVYRRERHSLHLDDKILTSWNALMIAAFCRLYQASRKADYLDVAKRADHFLTENLMNCDTLYVSYRNGKHGVKGFLDDYAAHLFAQLALYGATLDGTYLEKAKWLYHEVNRHFRDEEHDGYFFYGDNHESLILRPKETYDGAIPSGNSLMAWNLVRLSQLTADESVEHDAQRQLDFLAQAAAQYPTGHAMFLLALLNHENPPSKVTVVLDDATDISNLPLQLPADTAIILQKPTADYLLKNNKTTYYICRGRSCLPPTNELSMNELGRKGEC